MKIFKKLASVMIALPVLAALTACDNDNDYDPAEKLTNQQVFFSNELPETVELQEGQSSFTITLNRVVTKGELTVNLEATEEAETPIYRFAYKFWREN